MLSLLTVDFESLLNLVFAAKGQHLTPIGMKFGTEKHYERLLACCILCWSDLQLGFF